MNAYVIAEQRDKDGFWEGHTENYLKVKFSAKNVKGNLTGKLIKVKLLSQGDKFVYGEGEHIANVEKM